MLDLSRGILHETKENASLSLTELEERFGEDILNELAIKSELSGNEILMLRAYCAYMFQNKFLSSFHKQEDIKYILINRREITKLIVELFHSLFNPHIKEDSSDIEKQIHNQISKIDIIANEEIEVLKKLLELIDSTQRTNFYQKDNSGKLKNYISLKIDLKSVKNAPEPVPHMIVFVYSKMMEGCILRGGKIARGGIRWSDREDFVTEILALMRAQKLKNTLIIPDGAKGGFIVKDANLNQTNKEIKNAGIEAYSILLRGMLDITDNYRERKVIKPVDVICRDDDDVYLVVAADKGTGDFSDIANKIAKEYNFWLGDAFASGGSVGYNHKELGITSRSTWVSVEEHFNSLNVNPDQDIFSAVAIGSMSGDVCGNGMLLSSKIKLLAAFSSKWIFVDPNPDIYVSFEERQRLFNLSGSNWIDYSPEKISKGGGIFSRDSSFIPLSKEMQDLFSLKIDKISPNDLIKHILTLKVDLLWSGAVGTYVKTKSESHEQAMDKNNDILRVNVEDLRCKIVAEGANLTFTQLARIEYALRDGLINTDFIDNSGGVDCSDHEVNLKILLNKAVLENKITREARNVLLKEIQGDVVKTVIENSKAQNYSLSIGVKESVNFLKPYLNLISILKDKVNLDVQFEQLPDIKELDRRKKLKIGLVRPELSILLSYSKRAAYDDLMKLDDDFIKMFCERILLEYFPKKIRENFQSEISNHPLKKEICITKLANNIIDHTGIYFFHLIQSSSDGIKPLDIAKSYLTAWKDLNMENSWNQAAQESDYEVRLESFFTLHKRLCDQMKNYASG